MPPIPIQTRWLVRLNTKHCKQNFSKETCIFPLLYSIFEYIQTMPIHFILMKKILLVFCLSVGLFSQVFANNVTLSNISLTDQNITGHYCNIKFDISWDNSWRTATSVPGNWDACWLIAKFRVNNGDWYHCLLSTSAADHTAPSGSTVYPAPDAMGVFIYRSTDGNGSNNWTNAKLRWEYGMNGVSDDALVEVRLFAVEMVYIPAGDFYIGDGDGVNESLYALHHESSNYAVQITSSLVLDIRVDNSSVYDDGQIKNTGIGIDGDGGLDINNDGVIENDEFPTGYRQFYVMKYEISQEQYCAFLNTLTREQQQARVETDISGTSVTNVFVMTNTVGSMGYNGICCATTIPAAPAPVEFFCDLSGDGTPNPDCDGQFMASNYMNWRDGAAYADWAGLRPMTELEYEKVTRGPNLPVLGEYSWGNTNIAPFWSSYTSILCSYSSVILSPNENTGRATYYYSVNSLVRCGIFASSSINHTRQEAGAAYYGVMEMSGNLTEPVVNVGTVAGRSYRAVNGNGELDDDGNANVDYWPGINGNDKTWIANTVYGGTTGVTESAGSGIKGGSYANLADFLIISHRAYTSSSYNLLRQQTDGHRFVRNAF